MKTPCYLWVCNTASQQQFFSPALMILTKKKMSQWRSTSPLMSYEMSEVNVIKPYGYVIRKPTNGNKHHPSWDGVLTSSKSQSNKVTVWVNSQFKDQVLHILILLGLGSLFFFCPAIFTSSGFYPAWIAKSLL